MHASSRKSAPEFREKRSLISIVLALAILASGLFSIVLGAAGIFVSAQIKESWAPTVWELFARSGMMLFVGVYVLLDIAFGLVFAVCSYFVFRVKHMEFAALTGVAAGLSAVFAYGLGEWWTQVGQTNYLGLGVVYARVILQGSLPLVACAASLTVQREEAKTLMGRRIRSFWTDFSHNRIGLLGVALLSAYVVSAIFVPIVSLGIDPNKTKLADNRVPPEWMTMLNPAMSDVPRSSNYATNWTTANLEFVPDYIRTHPNFTWALDQGSFVLNISGIVVTETTPFCVILESSSFNYTYDPPRGLAFKIMFDVTVDPRSYKVAYNQLNQSYVTSSITSKSNVEINLTTPSATLSLWDAEWSIYQLSYLVKNYAQGLEPINLSSADQRLITNKQTYMTVLSSDLYWGYRMNYVNPGGGIDPEGLSRALFGTKGNRFFRTYIFIAPYSTGGEKPIHFYAKVAPASVSIKGTVWGLMGTDHLGRDVWSRTVHGVKISLAIGMIAALISLSLGVLVGVVSGYLGGTTGELMMRSVDVLMALPVLPLLIVLTTRFGRNIWYIVMLIAFFGWQGLSRVIRSRVLSLREVPFVESATASGATRTHIMLRHILPNVLPVILSDFVLSVPGAIVSEAGLSFLGFGDPRTPTWGREFNIMWIDGGAFSTLAWWWIVPPTVAITMLCLAFVFLGHALDEVVNPKLRRRR